MNLIILDQFLSTPSGWRATGNTDLTAVTEAIFLSTPSGWRATCNYLERLCEIIVFLSTPSGWRATEDKTSLIAAINISIHALRVEGDFMRYTPRYFGV